MVLPTSWAAPLTTQAAPLAKATKLQSAPVPKLPIVQSAHSKDG